MGEIHAFRFLRSRFGEQVVTRDAWVSEIRLKVVPLVPGETDNTSDGLGYDFKFRHQRKHWHVEVKATTENDPQFEFGISEIEAASRLSRTPGCEWRILRVNRALSDQPDIEWLPNPFQEDYGKYFRLREGGMRVSYARRQAQSAGAHALAVLTQ